MFQAVKKEIGCRARPANQDLLKTYSAASSTNARSAKAATAICRLKAGSSTVEITALAWGAASEHVNLVGDTVSGGLHSELLKTDEFEVIPAALSATLIVLHVKTTRP
jgi:hypothetical protein